MKARLFCTAMLILSVVLLGVSGRSEAAPPTPAAPARATSFNCANVTQIPLQECQALVTLYSATNGSNWNNVDGWLATDTPCNLTLEDGAWYGVKCSGGHVTELRLSSNNLVGSIPQEIHHLTQLTVLNLAYNKLTGWIPSVLGDLIHLTSLSLGYNPGLTWLIPWELGSLTNLEELSLTGCNLFGPIPSSFENLDQLRSLDLSFNYLSGWVDVVGELPALEELYLRNNQQLRGPLPYILMDRPMTAVNFGFTALCEWNDSSYQDWIYSLIGDDPDHFYRTEQPCAALPATVVISQAGADVVTTWTHQDPNTVYQVHGSGQPYFTPTDSTRLGNPLPPAPTGVYTDTNALATAGNRFYIVQSKYVDQSADSNETAEFTYELVKGQ